jgi:hypothetical protein
LQHLAILVKDLFSFRAKFSNNRSDVKGKGGKRGRGRNGQKDTLGGELGRKDKKY